jgi:hypothetical protein
MVGLEQRALGAELAGDPRQDAVGGPVAPVHPAAVRQPDGASVPGPGGHLLAGDQQQVRPLAAGKRLVPG